MAYITLPQAGVDFSATYAAATAVTSTTGLDQPSPPWAVGTVELGSNGTEWVFCKAGGTITSGDFLIITTATFVATAITSTLARAALFASVGVAGASTTVDKFLWVCRKGYLASANVATSATAFTALHTTATGGRLDSNSSANTTATVSPAIGLATAASNTAAINIAYPAVVSALD
jgi:hypothetical protein